MQEFPVFILGGLLIVLAAWVPLFLRGIFISLPMIAVAAGLIVGAVGGAEDPLLAYGVLAERVAAVALLVAVLGAGLRIDRPFSLRGWESTWRLLLIVMPLSIAAVAVMAHGLLGLSLGPALLLGAIASPTDPVLAAGVQAGPPGAGEEGEPKFALTAEAGLNDGLAMPFVSLGLLLTATAAPDTARLLHWFLAEFLWNVAGGIATGALLGAALVWVNRRLPESWRLPNSNSGIVALGLALVAYGAAEGVHANGFVAVFCEAVAIRNLAHIRRYSRRLSNTTAQLERVAMVLLVVLLGISIGNGLLADVGWAGVGFALLLLVVRLVLVPAAFIGSAHGAMTRAALGFFGIRGIGSLYYASFVLNEAGIDPGHRLTANAGLVVLTSILLYGTTTDFVAKRLLGRPPQENAG